MDENANQLVPGETPGMDIVRGVMGAVTLPMEFYIEAAIGVLEPGVLCEKYGLSLSVAEAMEDDPVYQHRLALAQYEVEKSGEAFRGRARGAAGMLLEKVIAIANDDVDVAPNVRLDAFKTLARLGGLDRLPEDESGAPMKFVIEAPDGMSGDVNIQVNSAIPPAPSSAGAAEVLADENDA